MCKTRPAFKSIISIETIRSKLTTMRTIMVPEGIENHNDIVLKMMVKIRTAINKEIFISFNLPLDIGDVTY